MSGPKVEVLSVRLSSPVLEALREWAEVDRRAVSTKASMIIEAAVSGRAGYELARLRDAREKRLMGGG